MQHVDEIEQNVDEIDDVVTERLDDMNLPGASVDVMRNVVVEIPHQVDLMSDDVDG